MTFHATLIWNLRCRALSIGRLLGSAPPPYESDDDTLPSSDPSESSDSERYEDANQDLPDAYEEEIARVDRAFAMAELEDGTSVDYLATI